MIVQSELPLSRFAIFNTRDLDQAREEVGKIFCPHRLTTMRQTRLDACHHTVDLGGFSLNYVRYGADVVIEPGELRTFFLLQLPLTGEAEIQSGCRTLEASPVQGSLLSPSLGVRMRWSEDCAKLLVQIPRVAMERSLEALLGRRVPGPIEFDGTVRIDHGAGRRIAQIVHLLRDDAESDHPVLSRSGGGPQIREALNVALLRGLPHNHSNALSAPSLGIAPRHVRLAEEHMRAHVTDHLTMSDLAAVVGVSIRSLQEGFRQFREVTPMEALRNLRLDGARSALLRACPEDTVTSVAIAWGFVHLSRFAISYAERFRERPSQTLRRSSGI